MGDEQEKWRRALLKKLRGAAGVKARIDAGDGASLQRSQLAKGTASAVANLVARCVEAGLARDGPEIAEALAAGADGGIVAMAAANARGPDGEPGARARRKRERAAALAAASSQSGGGGGGEDAKRTRLDDGDRARGSSARAASASAPPGRSTPSPRRPTPTRHPSRSPRRRSQLCCEIRSTARRRWTRCSRPSRCTPPRSSDRARASRKGWTTPPTRDASCARAPAASRARVDARLCGRVDARGASSALWALATLASFRGEAGVGERERHAATRALVGALSTRPELRAAFNARDAANALWGCAKARVGLSDEITTRLASAVSGSAPGSAPPGERGANAVEASMALWALASMRGDGTIGARPARLAATGIVRRLAESVTVGPTSTEVDQHRIVANASWAAAKLSERVAGVEGEGEGEGEGEDPAKSSEFDAAATGLLRRFAAAAVAAGPAFQLESPRAAAQLVAALRPSLLGAARVGTPRDDADDDDVVAAMSILVHRGLRSCFARGREEMEKEARGKGRAGANGATVRKHPERIQKPSSDDLAAFCDAAEALVGLGVRVDAGYFRSAVAAACTGGPTALGWREAGRLEHCVFSVLGLGPVAATVTARRGSHRGGRGADGVPSGDDVAAAERLLRPGAPPRRMRRTIPGWRWRRQPRTRSLAVPGPDGPVASGRRRRRRRADALRRRHAPFTVSNASRARRVERDELEQILEEGPAGRAAAAGGRGVRRRDGSSSPHEGCVRDGLNRGRGEASRRGRRVDLRRGSRGYPRVRDRRSSGRNVRGRSGGSRRRSRRGGDRGRRRPRRRARRGLHRFVRGAAMRADG